MNYFVTARAAACFARSLWACTSPELASLAVCAEVSVISCSALAAALI
jgi:hypothetical protein